MPGEKPPLPQRSKHCRQRQISPETRAFQTKAGLTADGIYGPKTHMALQDALEPKVTVTRDTEIRAGNGLQYAVVEEAKTGDAFPKVADAANGWTAIALDDRVGWIPGNTNN